jgi:hypothetical protein
MHWHAYSWTGNGADRAHEAERRPEWPDFAAVLLPPMRTGDWLAKPASRIADTFDAISAAVTWLSAEYEAVRALLMHPESVPLAARIEMAVDLLPRRVDVQWGEWLLGGRFASMGVICCPNRHVAHPCPIRPR